MGGGGSGGGGGDYRYFLLHILHLPLTKCL